jgi:hypothetical protein
MNVRVMRRAGVGETVMMTPSAIQPASEAFDALYRSCVGHLFADARTLVRDDAAARVHHPPGVSCWRSPPAP